MSMKFGKNREVDKRYLNVPAKYILNYTGVNEGGKDKYDYPSYEEWVEEMKEFLNKETFEDFKKSGHVKEKKKKKGKDKTLCIVDFYGKHLALVGWRNADTFSVGKTRLCRVIYKNDKVYIRYKGKNIPISDKSGWVL